MEFMNVLPNVEAVHKLLKETTYNKIIPYRPQHSFKSNIQFGYKEFTGITDELIESPHLLRKMSDAADKAMVNHSAERAVKSILELATDCSTRMIVQNNMSPAQLILR